MLTKLTKLREENNNKIDNFLNCSLLNYSVFHVIVLQEQGCCELVLRLIMSPKASMGPKDWAEISFRSETL